jgi:hypothetical protein
MGLVGQSSSRRGKPGRWGGGLPVRREVLTALRLDIGDKLSIAPARLRHDAVAIFKKIRQLRKGNSTLWTQAVARLLPIPSILLSPS